MLCVKTNKTKKPHKSDVLKPPNPVKTHKGMILKTLPHGLGTLLILSSTFITTAREVIVPFRRAETAVSSLIYN